MAVDTPSNRALACANDLIAWEQRLEQLLLDARAISTRVTQGNFQGNWNAMATYLVSTNGTQGATDANPVNTHPIVGLNVPANTLQGFSFMVNDFITFMTSTNTSPPQQNREATIETAIS